MKTNEIETQSKRLCHQCVGENYLKEQIKLKGKKAKCAYCLDKVSTYSISQLADIIEEVFERHYEQTSDSPNSWQSSLLADKESEYEWEREGEPITYAIMNAGNFPEDAASDIQVLLEERHSDFDSMAMGLETPFSSEVHYEEKSTNDSSWQEDWRVFERSLKTEARFFSTKAIDHLNKIFTGIELLQTPNGRSIIVNAGPETQLSSLFRARVFQSDDKIISALTAPDKNIGPPPFLFAAPGRMNARGISVFYGANAPEVSLAEVRPPVGSQVVVAKFDILRPIKLLDLTALREVTVKGSIFDPSYALQLERAMFLRNLSQRITMPVMPDDEAFDYLATQAIADFLASKEEPPLDGIIFPSVQVKGTSLNVVLFNKSSRVEKIVLPLGTKVDVRLGEMTEDGWDLNYTITEEVQPRGNAASANKNELKVETEFPGLLEPLGTFNSDTRVPTLRIDLDAIDVHIIKSISFNSEKYKVHRLRWENDRSF